jgi:hypothetical protein
MALEADVSRVERRSFLDQLGRTIFGVRLQLGNDCEPLHVFSFPFLESSSFVRSRRRASGKAPISASENYAALKNR